LIPAESSSTVLGVAGVSLGDEPPKSDASVGGCATDGLIIAGVQGIAVGTACEFRMYLEGSPVSDAAGDADGGLVFQYANSLATPGIFWWPDVFATPASATPDNDIGSEPSLLIPVEGSETLTMFELTALDGSPTLLYRWLAVDEKVVDIWNGEIIGLTLDTTRGSRVFRETCGFECTESHVSIGGDLIVTSLSAEGLTWFEFQTSGDENLDISGNPFPDPPDDRYVTNGILAPDGSAIAYVETAFDPNAIRRSVVLYDLGQGTQVTSVVVETGATEDDLVYNQLDFDGRWVAVSGHGIAPLLVDLVTGKQQMLTGFDGVARFMTGRASTFDPGVAASEAPISGARGPGDETIPSGADSQDMLAYSIRDDAGNAAGIGIVNADGSGFTQLTDGPDYAPRWAPDGSRIAFLRGGGDLYVVNVDGAGLKRLPNIEPEPPPVGELGTAGFSWSPDGSEIALDSFGFREASQPQIFVAEVDGPGLRQLTDGSATFDTHPEWSPDGATIIYCNEGPESLLLGIPSVGGGTPNQFAVGNCDYDWSSDGSRIAFTSARDGDDDPGDSELFVYFVGQNIEQYTQNTSGVAAPSWSPDGSMLVFVMAVDGDPEIAVLDFTPGAGLAITRLTSNSAMKLSPVWSPDGSMIAYSSAQSGEYELWVVETDGDNPILLSPGPGEDPAWRP
jgi:Tol biopolymer transport system component